MMQSSPHVNGGLLSIDWEFCEARIFAFERVYDLLVLLTNSASRFVFAAILFCSFLDGFGFDLSPCFGSSERLCWVESLIRLALLGLIEFCSQLLKPNKLLDAENVFNALWIWSTSIMRLWLKQRSFLPFDGAFLFWCLSLSSDDTLVYWGLLHSSDMLVSPSDLIISSSVDRSLRIKSFCFVAVGVFCLTASSESLSDECVLSSLCLDLDLGPFPELQIGWFVMSTWLDNGLFIWGIYSSFRKLRSSSLISSSRLCCFWVAVFFKFFNIGRFEGDCSSHGHITLAVTSCWAHAHVGSALYARPSRV